MKERTKTERKWNEEKRKDWLKKNRDKINKEVNDEMGEYKVSEINDEGEKREEKKRKEERMKKEKKE